MAWSSARLPAGKPPLEQRGFAWLRAPFYRMRKIRQFLKLHR